VIRRGDILWFDGYVGIDEVGLVKAAYGNGWLYGDPLSGLGGEGAIPEPATVSLLVLGGLAMVRRLRR